MSDKPLLVQVNKLQLDTKKARMVLFSNQNPIFLFYLVYLILII